MVNKTSGAKRFAGALTATLILIGTVCGFVVVDLSTDRYMPSQTGTIFAVNEIGEAGISLVLTGTRYRIDSEPVVRTGGYVWTVRGLIPARLRAAAKIAGLLFETEITEITEITEPLYE